MPNFVITIRRTNLEEYLKKFLHIRKSLDIDIDFHAFQRIAQRGNIDHRYIKQVVQDGSINEEKCEEFSDKNYNKICLFRYFGKAKITIEIIVLHHETFNVAEVKTVWFHQGRK